MLASQNLTEYDENFRKDLVFVGYILSFVYNLQLNQCMFKIVKDAHKKLNNILSHLPIVKVMLLSSKLNNSKVLEN